MSRERRCQLLALAARELEHLSFGKSELRFAIRRGGLLLPGLVGAAQTTQHHGFFLGGVALLRFLSMALSMVVSLVQHPQTHT